MVQANIYFNEEEDKIIEKVSKELKINKNETVKFIVREYKVKNG